MKLNVKKLRKEKDTVVVSSKESLKDIEYIKWSDKVLSGKKTVDIKEMIKWGDVDINNVQSKRYYYYK